tara:strand:+ start:42605 stop:44536 length:1932 start_codon:yes stop_codon:yes gene_type:complete
MLKFYILTLGIYLICFTSNASENCSSLNSELKKAICFERDGEYKKATKLFKLSSKKYINHMEFFEFYDFYLNQKNYEFEEIEKFTKEYIEKYENSIFVKTLELMFSTYLYKESKFEELLSHVKKIEKKYKYNNFDYPYIIYYKAIGYEKSGKDSKAFREYLTLWSKYPNFKLIKNVEKKIKSSNKGIPKKFKVNRLQKLFENRDYKLFKKEYKPYNDSLKILRAQLFLMNNNAKRGLEILNNISEKDRSKSVNKELEIIAEAKYRISLYNLKKFDNNTESARDLKNILLKFPNYSKNSEVAYLSAKLFTFDKEFNEAKKVYDWLIKTKSKEYIYDSYWGMGWSEYMLGNYRSALNIFAYLEKSGKSYYESKGLYWKARCLEKLGNKEDSNKTYSLILSKFKEGYYVYLANLKINDGKNNTKEIRPNIVRKIDSLSQFIIDLEGGDRLIKEYQTHLIKNLDSKESIALLDILSDKKKYNLLIKSSYKTFSENHHKYPLAYKEIVYKNSQQYNVDKNLIFALMREESLFDSNAISWVGAKGLMQLMDKTKKSLEKDMGTKSGNVYKPNINIKLGTFYLSKLMKDFDNDLIRVIASYNAGPHNIRKWNKRFDGYDNDEFVESIPFKETHGYVKRVLRSYFKYNELN